MTMKKIIIAALTMLTLGATQAEYTLKVPLEQAQGGSLPNGSINIKSKKICLPYKAGMRWSKYQTTKSIVIVYMGTTILNSIDTTYALKSYQHGGYNYTPGNVHAETATYVFYELCRAPI